MRHRRVDRLAIADAVGRVFSGKSRWCCLEVDCLDALYEMVELMASAKDLEFDAIVCDPPYASGGRTEADKRARAGGMVRGRWADEAIDGDLMTTTGFVWMIREVARACRPLLRDGGSWLSFIDWRQWPNLVGALESENYRVNQQVVWDKDQLGMGQGFRNQHELCCHASKGVPAIHDHSVPNVLRHARADDQHHPSPKPIGLMEDLLRVVCPKGGVVLDPFAGGGTTGVAALRLGMRAVLLERDPRHTRTAAARLRAEENLSTLDAELAGQAALFGR